MEPPTSSQVPAPARHLLLESDWNGAHIVSVEQFPTPASLLFVCDVADLMRRIVERQGGCKLLEYKVQYAPETSSV
jgi:hypothetical protein